MPAPIEIRYRAFISYSHVDARWAEWLSETEGSGQWQDVVCSAAATRTHFEARAALRKKIKHGEI